MAKVFPPEKGSRDSSLKVSRYFLVKQNEGSFTPRLETCLGKLVFLVVFLQFVAYRAHTQEVSLGVIFSLRIAINIYICLGK